MFGLAVRQFQVARLNYIDSTRREIILEIMQRWVFGAFLFFFLVLLDIRTLFGITGLQMDVGSALGGFLTGYGGDAFLSWITAHVYPELRNKLKLRKKNKKKDSV